MFILKIYIVLPEDTCRHFQPNHSEPDFSSISSKFICSRWRDQQLRRCYADELAHGPETSHKKKNKELVSQTVQPITHGRCLLDKTTKTSSDQHSYSIAYSLKLETS